LTTLLAAPNSGSPFCITQPSSPACNSKLYNSPHTPERTHILYPHLCSFFGVVSLDTYSANEWDICSLHDKFPSKGRHKDALLILSSTDNLICLPCVVRIVTEVENTLNFSNRFSDITSVMWSTFLVMCHREFG
jgi:hypothetical protein